jgi:methionyl-tRNA formyltransferase
VTDGRAPGSRVRTVFLGSGGFGRDSLRRLVASDEIEVVGVISAPPRPVGRRQEVTRTPIHGLAASLGMDRVLTPGRLRAPSAIAEVLAVDPELAVLADYGQIVPAALLELAHGALNLHPSLLPRHRGASPIPAAILAGDPETGVTLMRMDDGLDSGPIIDQVTHALTGFETAPELEAVLEVAAADLLMRDLGPWLRGELTAAPQPSDGMTMTRPLRRDDGRLDPLLPARQLERRIRAYQPWPGCFLDTAMGRLIVWSAAAGAGRDVPSGRLDAVGLSTAAGTLRLDEVQPAGGKRMAWADFIRGRPTILGTSVVSAA